MPAWLRPCEKNAPVGLKSSMASSRQRSVSARKLAAEVSISSNNLVFSAMGVDAERMLCRVSWNSGAPGFCRSALMARIGRL